MTDAEPDKLDLSPEKLEGSGRGWWAIPRSARIIPLRISTEISSSAWTSQTAAEIAIEAMLRTRNTAGFVKPGSVKAGGFTEMTELEDVHRIGRRLIIGARAAKDRGDPEIG
jgi:hypothetical protein